METRPTFTAETEEELWRQVAADMAQREGFMQYTALLQQGRFWLLLDIDIDLGGGFEGGFEITTLSVLVPGHPPLHFHLHQQDWVNEIGKLLGLEDIQLGYPELDDAFIVQTNSADLLRRLLAPADMQATLLKYREDMQLTLAPAETDAEAGTELRFTVERAVVEPEQLREIYHMLYALFEQLAPALPTHPEVSDEAPHSRSR